jgi:hypothetical protein
VADLIAPQKASSCSGPKVSVVKLAKRRATDSPGQPPGMSEEGGAKTLGVGGDEGEGGDKGGRSTSMAETSATGASIAGASRPGFAAMGRWDGGWVLEYGKSSTDVYQQDFQTMKER